MYYLYDKDSMEYTHATGVKPDNDFYTTLAPLHPDDEVTFHTRLYQPDTDTWLQIDKNEYSKMLESQKPTQDQMTQAQMMFSIAQLTKEVNELKGDKDVSNN